MNRQQAEDLAETIRLDTPVPLLVTVLPVRNDGDAYACQIQSPSIPQTDVKSVEQWIGLVESGVLLRTQALPAWATPQGEQTARAYYIWERNERGDTTGKTAGPFSLGDAELVKTTLEAMGETYTYEITSHEPEAKRRQKQSPLS